MKRSALIAMLLVLGSHVHGQVSGGVIRGSFESNFQYYIDDEKLNINDSTLAGRRTAMNTYANLLYSSNNLEAGIRYEYFAPPLMGYDRRYEGMGVAHRYIRYHDETWDLTAGNFYEQFGNGMLFRSYQDWALGFDNSLDGFRLRVKPAEGISLKMVSGVQRLYWDRWTRDSERGILTGADVEVNLNQAIGKLRESRTNVIFGGSFLSRYQRDSHPFYRTPRNTAGFAGRFNVNRGGFSLIGEYTYRINDPSSDNGMIYKPGEAIYLLSTYSVKGLAFSLGAKRLDNISFRSDRSATLNDLMINYLPAINKQHSYSLPAQYPYATQPNGELGITASVGYNLKRGSFLGGRFGTNLTLQYSRITDILRNPLDENTAIGQSGTQGYTSDYFGEGEKFFEDLSIELQRRLSRNLRLTLMYAWIYYNIAVIEGHAGDENVVSNSFVADLTWRLPNRQALRFETQHLGTAQDKGSWLMGLLEYTNRGFFVTAQNMWNYGNPSEEKQIHYIMVSTGFTKGGTRVMGSYGRQKEGIICIGGVCRFVPAVSGLSLTITSSF
jgi:hypothetical protein